MNDATRVTWDELMRVGLGALRLPPATFWAMTIPEFRCTVTCGRPSELERMNKAQLEDLLRTYPDEDKHERAT